MERADTRVSLLGKPALFVDGALQLFGGPRKAIALLAYILLHRDRPLSRAALAEQFWPDDDDEDARAALRRYLHRALAVLPASSERKWVLADKKTIRWNPDAPLGVDTFDYERLTKEGRRSDAVVLYRGDYLEDFYDDWILVERERLRNMHAGNLLALVEEARRALDYPAAIAYAQALLLMDPLREDAVRRLMSLRFAAGDRSGALADFESFSRRLREELSADPMPETIAVREAILRQEMPNESSGPLSVEKPAAGFPFVGRADELRMLRRVWEAAAHGRGSALVISGEAGIGKSRLLGELTALAEAQGGRVAVGTTSTTESEPYQPIAEALRAALPLLRIQDVEPIKLSALAALVPEIRDLLPELPAPPALDSERERHRLFDAVCSTLVTIAVQRPLLLVVEDLHWATAATVELLGLIFRRLQSSRALVAVSVREESLEANEAVRELLRRLSPDDSYHLGLGPLTIEDVRALHAQASSDALEAAQSLHDRTGGNPLFVTELLRELRSGATPDTIPATIGEMVRARVERLSATGRHLLDVAAIAGAGFDADVVRHVLNWTFAETFDALDELLDCALVRESPRRRSDFVFSHQLVHAALYEAMPETDRQRLHRRFGRTLDKLFSGRPALAATIARHLDRAGAEEEAVPHFVRAIDHALAVFSHNEAMALATRALELASEPRIRFYLHRAREEAASRSGDPRLQEIDCRAMLELATAIGDDELQGFALCRSIALAMHTARRQEERDLVEVLQDLSRRTGSSIWSLEAALARGRMEINAGDQRSAEATLAEVATLAETVADDRLALEYFELRSFVASLTSLERARAYLESVRPRAIHGRSLRARYLRAVINIDDRAGDTVTLDQHARELLEHYIECGDVAGQGLARQQLAVTAWYRMDVEAERDHLRRALEAFSQVDKRASVAAVTLNRGVFVQHLGDFEAAGRDYVTTLELARAGGYRHLEALALANLASLELFGERFERARALAIQALAFARKNELAETVCVAAETLGIAERESGRYSDAGKHLEEALAIRRAHDPRGILETLIEIIPLYLAVGEHQRAVDAAEELLRGLEGDRYRVTFPAQALAAAASAFEATGRHERAEALHREASLLLEEIGAKIPDAPSRAGYMGLLWHRAVRKRGQIGEGRY